MNAPLISVFDIYQFLLLELLSNISLAVRTDLVFAKPVVNAVDMEYVLATWQHLHSFALFKHVKADRAFFIRS